MAGRPKKETAIAPIVTEEVNVDVNKDVLAENEALKQQMAQMQAMMIELSNKVNNQPQPSMTQSVYDGIPPNKQIKIMSNCFGELNLSTEGFGNGRTYKFNKFGQSRSIVYSDVSDIINSNQSFMEKGKFLILDKDVIDNHGLQEIYEKIIDSKTIENILSLEKSEIEDIINSCPKSQVETISYLIIEGMKNGKDVDLNKLQIISKKFGRDIYKEVEEMKNIIEE